MKQLPVFEIEDVLNQLNDTPALKRVTRFITSKSIVRATRRFPPRKGDSRTEVVLTIGAPNYQERRIVERAKRDKMTPPESVMTFFPKKKGKR